MYLLSNCSFILSSLHIALLHQNNTSKSFLYRTFVAILGWLPKSPGILWSCQTTQNCQFSRPKWLNIGNFIWFNLIWQWVSNAGMHSWLFRQVNILGSPTLTSSSTMTNGLASLWILKSIFSERRLHWLSLSGFLSGSIHCCLSVCRDPMFLVLSTQVVMEPMVCVENGESLHRISLMET